MLNGAKRLYDGAWSLIGYSKPSMGIILEGLRKNKEALRVLEVNSNKLNFLLIHILYSYYLLLI